MIQWMQVVENNMEKMKMPFTGIKEAEDVRHQHHYDYDIQPIDYLRGSMTCNKFRGYCQGNIIKYVTRYDRKGGVEDLRKAQQYLEWMVDSFSGTQE